MMKFRVNQLVLCQVRVTRVVEAECHEHALSIISESDAPTSVDGCDYEIVNDVEVQTTTVLRVKE